MLDTSLCEMLLENDLNPFILFDSQGKLKDFNKEAEFLFNIVNYKELFELAVENAPHSYGVNKKYIQLSYDKFKYYAIVVAYVNEDEIALRLFKEVCNDDNEKSINDNIEFVNIYSLIDLSKNTILMQSDINIDEVYDVSIPEVKININDFLITLNESFNLYKDEKSLKLKVYIKTGEYEVIKGIKYNIVCIEFQSNNIQAELSNTLLETSSRANIYPLLQGDTLKLEFIMII